jgi:hypothetical protein
MSYDIVDGKIIPRPKDKKTCRACDRVLPLNVFPKNGRYLKPYCRGCHNAFHALRNRIDRSENRSVTMKEFRDYWLPLMTESGEATWLNETYAEEAPQDPYPSMTEEEGNARQAAIYEKLMQTLPARTEH